MFWFPWCCFMCLSWFGGMSFIAADKSVKVFRNRPECNNHILVFCLRSAAKFQQKIVSCYFLTSAVGGLNSSEETVSVQLKSLYCGSCLSGKSQSVYADESVSLQQDRNQLNHFAKLLFFPPLFILNSIIMDSDGLLHIFLIYFWRIWENQHYAVCWSFLFSNAYYHYRLNV